MFTKTLSWLENKKILILGLAREGQSTFNFLRQYVPSAKIYLTDQKNPELLDEPIKIAIEKKEAAFIGPSMCQNENFDVIFKTPGIPHTVLAKTFGIAQDQVKLYSNTQLFFDLLREYSQAPLTIGITGTKGKSTTTSLIYHVLQRNLQNVYLAGNIGVPPLELLSQANTDEKNIFVLEMSCHQLADLKTSPNFAVVLDISPDHLDYYPTFDDYFDAKSAIVRFQKKSDLVFYNQDSKTATKMAKIGQAEKRPFSLEEKSLIEYIHASHTPLAGEHNLYNTMPAILIARELGIDDNKISEAITTFKPVSHRLELVATKNMVRYYDDSASSAPEATVAALKAFAGNKIVLIAGGSDKGVTFESLAKAIIDSQVEGLILFPTTGEKILNSILELEPNHHLSTMHRFASSMTEAVDLASKLATPDTVVLLSPACASYNMFKNYEDRGNQFKALVLSL